MTVVCMRHPTGPEPKGTELPSSGPLDGHVGEGSRPYRNMSSNLGFLAVPVVFAGFVPAILFDVTGFEVFRYLIGRAHV